MKVMCLKKDNWFSTNRGAISIDKDPVFGEVCIVEDIRIKEDSTYYKLNDYRDLYHSKHFIPLSEIDENEFEREYSLETIKN